MADTDKKIRMRKLGWDNADRKVQVERVFKKYGKKIITEIIIKEIVKTKFKEEMKYNLYSR